MKNALIEEIYAAMVKADPHYCSRAQAEAVASIVQRETLKAGQMVKEAAIAASARAFNELLLDAKAKGWEAPYGISAIVYAIEELHIPGVIGRS